MEQKKLDAEFALHEFSVRYRAALAKQYAQAEKDFYGIREAVREQHLQDQRPHHGIEAPKIEPPEIRDSGIEAPKIEEPKIESPRQPNIEPEM